jgi:hypothetical protein
MPETPWEAQEIIGRIRELQRLMLVGLREQLLRAAGDELAGVAAHRGGDVIYRIDEKGEEILVEYCEEWGRSAPFLLIAEGISASGERMFPAGTVRDEATFRLIVDPIDGTRGLMYDKRSAWILTGWAPNRGETTSLRDIRCAVMTEAPTTRARYADQLWAVRGQGARGVRYDLSREELIECGPVRLSPSGASDLRHGFAAISQFFPGGKELTARIEERLFAALLGPPEDGTPQVFDDEYISNGGQLYELMVGHDRFTADLRPLILPRACGHEGVSRLCAHPYDLCCELIAREAGVEVATPYGDLLDAPLSVHHDVAWVAYANAELRRRIEPVLQQVLREEGML